jgi:hypothetical protein
MIVIALEVKVKTEVAESNYQAQQLSQMLKDLARKTDACQNPNLDKEVRCSLPLDRAARF